MVLFLCLLPRYSVYRKMKEISTNSISTNNEIKKIELYFSHEYHVLWHCNVLCIFLTTVSYYKNLMFIQCWSICVKFIRSYVLQKYKILVWMKTHNRHHLYHLYLYCKVICTFIIILSVTKILIFLYYIFFYVNNLILLPCIM